MSILDFGSDGPSSDPTFSSEATGTSDLTCEVCAGPINWSGRGRRPKYCEDHRSSSSRSSSSSSRTTRGKVSDAELNAACENLHTVYDGLVWPLALVSPRAGQAWMEQIPGLDARNRTFLANNKDLVKRINSTAEKGGSFAFAVSHLIAVAPVAMVVYSDFTRAANEKRQSQPSYASPAYDFDVSDDGTATAGPGPFEGPEEFDPDAAFRKASA